MKIRKIPLMLSMLLLFTMIPMMTYAELKPSFILNSSTSHAIIGDEVVVTVEGNTKNVFEYELRLTYDTNLLTFIGASTKWEGFTVSLNEENGEVTIEQTKLGNVKGASGATPLASVRFKAIGQGDTSVNLTHVKLTDSESNIITTEPNLLVKVNIPVNYVDTKGHWAEEDILRATRMGWINGYSDSTFKPNDQITRAEFTTVLSRAVNLSAASSEKEQIFKDQERIPDYAVPHVSQLVAAGLVNGYEDETFRPSNWITRSEITVVLTRLLGYEDQVNTSLKLYYDDKDQVPTWAFTAIATAEEIGLIKGRGNNRFEPNGYTTRAEAIILILRTVDQMAYMSK